MSCRPESKNKLQSSKQAPSQISFYHKNQLLEERTGVLTALYPPPLSERACLQGWRTVRMDIERLVFAQQTQLRITEKVCGCSL